MPQRCLRGASEAVMGSCKTLGRQHKAEGGFLPLVGYCQAFWQSHILVLERGKGVGRHQAVFHSLRGGQTMPTLVTINCTCLVQVSRPHNPCLLKICLFQVPRPHHHHPCPLQRPFVRRRNPWRATDEKLQYAPWS